MAMKNVNAPIDYPKARQLLIKKLGMKSYSTRDIRRWMKEKGVDSDIAERLIAEFQQGGYLDDAAYLQTFVRSQRARRYGPRAIALKLMQKGFSEKEIAQALDGEVDDSSAVRQLLDTRYRSRNLSDPRERQKVIASLMRRGFSLDVILNTIK